ncbi:hypothetical protein ACFP2T_00400 [Plantactinospora solaniradicis]|uniref:ESX-1 secretion-associated protein n=1 Tax=Plantactinospora solaniradicis TaxID=1723736 RepID=A0ABW1JYT2_9ACTN
MAEIVGGDLYHLWRVSDVHLPRIADVYYDASRALGGATGDDDGAFRANTPTGPGGTIMSSGGAAAWGDLRDEMQRMYGQIGGTILNAGEAIRRAQRAYVDADMASADALSQYLHDPTNHDPNNPASNPPRQGADDHPGEPYQG